MNVILLAQPISLAQSFLIAYIVCAHDRYSRLFLLAGIPGYCRCHPGMRAVHFHKAGVLEVVGILC